MECGIVFKWLKQHLKIKKFWGTSENAVRIQIYCSIITYCLVVIIKHDMKLERSVYEILRSMGFQYGKYNHTIGNESNKIRCILDIYYVFRFCQWRYA